VCLFFAFYPEIAPSQTHAPLYTWLYGLLDNSSGNSPTALVIVFFLTLAGQLRMLHIYTQNSSLKESRTYMPLFWFLLFLLVTGIIAPLSPIFFINFIGLLILNINNKEQHKKIKYSFYLSGLLVGIASLIETSAILLFIFVLIMALIKETNKFKELIIAFSGLFTVYLYLFAGYFLTDNLSSFVQFFDPQNWICPYLQVLDYTPAQFMLLGYIILIFIYVCIFFVGALRNRTIQIRERAGHFHLFTLVMLFVSGMNINYLTNVIIISFSMYYAMLNTYRNNWIVRDILLLLSVLIFLFIEIWS
jgi:hypothetical protein